MKYKQIKKQINYDFSQGILCRWYYFLPVILISIIECAVFTRRINQWNLDMALLADPTFSDYLIHIFKGMEVFENVRSENTFFIPAFFICFHIYLSYLTAQYPLKDLRGFGQQTLLRSGSKSLFWSSKYVWTFFHTLCYYFVCYITVFLYSCIFGQVGRGFSDELQAALSGVSLDEITGLQIFMTVILVPMLVSAVLSMLQLFVSVAANQIAGMITVITIIVTSAYFCSPYLPGNYLMLLRSHYVIPRGVLWSNGLLMIIPAAILLYFLGRYIFQKQDLLTMKGDI